MSIHWENGRVSGTAELAQEQVNSAFAEYLRAQGLPDIQITVEDRLRGAIVSAIAEIEAGHTAAAYRELKLALTIEKLV